MLKCLLLDGNGVATVTQDKASQKLTVQVDRSKIASHGKLALGRMLLRLHIYWYISDAKGCRAYYEALSQVDGEYFERRQAVLENKSPSPVFVHPDTFLTESSVAVKEWETTAEVVIHSWVERDV